MKTIIKTRPNGTNRVSIDYSDEKLITDQAAEKELTMASIVKKLEKGIMPNIKQGLVYSNDPQVRNLQDVVERSNEINDLFYQLPTELRDQMGHDIKNLEKVIFDEKNIPLLEKYGLIVSKKDNHKELINAINGLKPSDLTPSEG